MCAALWASRAATARNLRAGMQSLGANTNVLAHAGKTLALVEGGVANYELTDELDTVGPCDFDGTLSGGYTAHPHRDPHTGELHAVSYSFARGQTVQYSVIDTDGHARRTVDIEVSGSPMMHDFSLTDKYVVLYDLPVTLRPHAGVAEEDAPVDAASGPDRGRSRRRAGPVPGPIAAMFNRNEQPAYQLPYAWNPKYPARIGVMPREGGNNDVRWFEIEPCYVYHPLNAYSEMRDGHEVLVLDVVRYDADVRPRPARARRRHAHPGPLDDQPGHRRGDHRTPRRPFAGVSPDQRDPAGQPAPLRLHRRHRRRLRRIRQIQNVLGALQARLRDRIEHGRPARPRAC